MYLQTLMLALTERGLGTCVEVSVAVGYTDPDFPTNKLRIGRDPVAKNVMFLDN